MFTYKTVNKLTFAIHQVPDYISESIWLWGVFMSHALDERLQPLLSCIDMGHNSPVPLGTTQAFCSGVLPITATFYGIRIIHCNAGGKALTQVSLFLQGEATKYRGEKHFPQSDGDICWDDLSLRRDFNLLAYVMTEQSLSCLFLLM